jgi:Uma2 family endonuclease
MPTVHAKKELMAGALTPDITRPLLRREYDKLVELGAFEDERIELLRGVLVPMSPIGPPHSSTIDRLTKIFVLALWDKATVRVQNPFAALEDSEPEPDISVVPLGDYDEAHPERAELLIEVAESSLARDRGIKLQIYAENGVPEYWVVNLVNHRIEVYSEPSSAGYRTVRHFERGQSVRLIRFPGLEVAVDDVLK